MAPPCQPPAAETNLWVWPPPFTTRRTRSARFPKTANGTIALSRYLEAEPAGHALLAPADISWGPDTLVQPDVFVVPLEQARSLDWSRIQELLLVAEVLSPSSARADRFTKRIEYQRRRVPVYWIVDPDERRVEVWEPDDVAPRFEREQLLWHPAGAMRPLELDLRALFRPI